MGSSLSSASESSQLASEFSRDPELFVDRGVNSDLVPSDETTIVLVALRGEDEVRSALATERLPSQTRLFLRACKDLPRATAQDLNALPGTITSFTFQYCTRSNEMFAGLFALLAASTERAVTKVVVQDCGLTDAEALALAEVIRSHEGLVHVDISGNKAVTEAGRQAIKTAMGQRRGAQVIVEADMKK